MWSRFLTERDLNDFDTPFASFIIELPIDLPYFLALLRCFLSLQYMFMSVAFFLERKRKHLDIFLRGKMIL